MVSTVAPAILCQYLVKIVQQRLLLFERNCHVILDCIQATQDEVEEANGDEQLRMQLFNDGSEGPRCLVEEVEASLQRL
jgi:hypothetical protein